MVRGILFGACWSVVATSAWAAPMTVVHQGRVTTTEGVPVTGSHSVTARLYDGTNNLLFEDTFTGVAFDGGYFTVVLGSGVALEAADLAPAAVYVALALDGGAELPIRQRLHAVPYAIEARHASGVTLGAVTTCDVAGTLRWTGVVEVCNGSAWVPIQGAAAPPVGSVTDPGVSCRQLKSDYPSLASGVFYIDPNGAAAPSAFPVYCENDIGGGGWTRVATIDASIRVCSLASPLGTTSDVANGVGTAWLDPAVVDAIPRVENEVLLWDHSANWVRFTSTNANWNWTNVANGTINNVTVDTYGVSARRHNESTFTALTDGLACSGNPCLMGGYTPGSNWTVMLGIGSNQRGAFVQDATCTAVTSAYRGMHGGMVNVSWDQNGYAYVR